jgi:hypothetical protein
MIKVWDSRNGGNTLVLDSEVIILMILIGWCDEDMAVVDGIPLG